MKGEGVKSCEVMESITKSSIAFDTISKMAEIVFPSDKVSSVKELTEGYFNTAYLVAFESGEELILKIAPPKEVAVMSYEKDIMRAEVECMRLVKEVTDVPVPDILYYDDSRVICPSDYFFMTKLAGDSFSTIQEKLPQEVKDSVELMTGKYNARINSIQGEGFGYYNGVKKNMSWFEVFLSFIEDIYKDADKVSVDIGAEYAEVMELLQKHRDCFSEVTTPRLVHWDLWEGNVFVSDNTITGLIDFERCMWADILLELGFRSLYQKPGFLEGYGKKQFTEAEKVRILWYDLYQYLLMSMECEYRKYSDKGIYSWAKGQVEKIMEQLRAVCI